MPPAMGQPPCSVVPQAANSTRSALSMRYCGARAYPDVLTDDVVPGRGTGIGECDP